MLSFALLASSCVNESPSCPAVDDESDNVTLQFIVATRTPGDSQRDARGGQEAPSPSKAPANPDDDCYDDERGFAAENFIDVTDVQFLLFDDNGILLRPFYPEVSVQDADFYTNYLMKATFTEPYFDRMISEAKAANALATTDVSFSIMVIANGKGMHAVPFALYPGVTTIADVARELRTFDTPPHYESFTVGDIVSKVYTPWSPSIAEKRLIPMAGLQKFTIKAVELASSSPNEPANLTPDTNTAIPMLRTMAKIEIIDHLEFSTTEEYDPDALRMKVDKVELCGFYSKGTLLPWMGANAPGYISQWTNVSTQVTSPTNPGDYYLPPVEFSESGYGTSDNIFNFGNPIVTTGYNKGFPVFSLYIPEYSLSWLSDADVKPYIVITLENSDSDQGGTIKKLELSTYQNGKPVANSDIPFMLRNHIYRYEINGADNPQNIISVGFTVCDMFTPEIDIPTFN